MDNHSLLTENMEKLIAAFGITVVTRTFKPLYKPTLLHPHHIIAVNWMTEREDSFPKGGLLADDCSTGKGKPCCALDILFATHTLIRL